jgi:hypothetical protein
MNISLQEDEIRKLLNIELPNFALSELPIGNSYEFSSPFGKLTFENVDGIYQVTSSTGDHKEKLFKSFCSIAEHLTIEYTASGFEH